MYNVLIAGRSPDELNTLASIISQKGNILQIVGAFSDCNQILPFLKENAVDILILNIPHSPANEVALLQKAQSLYPKIRYILTADSENINQLQKAFALEVDHYLLWPVDARILLDTLHTATHKLWPGHAGKILSSSRGHGLQQRGFTEDAYSPLLINQLLEQQLLNQEYTNCLTYLDRFFSEAQHDISPETLKNHIVELVVYVINILWQHNINVSQLFGNSTALLSKVLNFQDLGELHAWTNNFISTVIDALENNSMQFSPCVAHAVAHIQRNFAQEISLKTMACEMNINAAYLGQLFKLETGQLFSVFLNNVRIENAQKLLLNSNLSINEVSVQSGYTNISYFYNIFKKHTGKTPSQYRNANT